MPLPPRAARMGTARGVPQGCRLDLPRRSVRAPWLGAAPRLAAPGPGDSAVTQPAEWPQPARDANTAATRGPLLGGPAAAATVPPGGGEAQWQAAGCKIVMLENTCGSTQPPPQPHLQKRAAPAARRRSTRMDCFEKFKFMNSTSSTWASPLEEQPGTAARCRFFSPSLPRNAGGLRECVSRTT